jgi:hypothetical protein
MTPMRLDRLVQDREERATVAAKEDRRVFDILDGLASLCPMCGKGPKAGVAAGCRSCVAKDQIMETVDGEILAILADTCPACLRRTEEGAEKGCHECAVREVMTT